MDKQTENTTIKDFVWEIVKFAVIAAIIVIPIRMFVAQPFIVEGRSMDPTFATGQYLIVNELTNLFEGPKRGEIIIFKYPKNIKTYFIKRVIGLPNETVDINKGVVTIKSKANPKGFILKEPYVEFTKDDTSTKTLGPNEYFVMGDNRAESLDSRIWGPVPAKLIVGEALFRLFPLSKVGIMPGVFQQKK